MHAIPVKADGVVEVLRDNYIGHEIGEFDEINNVVPRNSSYLYFEDSRQRKFAFAVGQIPSQYIRKLVAQEIGKKDWDWRSSNFEPELLSVTANLRPIFPDFVRG